VLPLIPEDDPGVRAVVNGWSDSVPFNTTVGRLCDLSKHSTQYVYNAVAVLNRDLQQVLVPTLGSDNVMINQDIVIRPSDRKGMTYCCLLVHLYSFAPFYCVFLSELVCAFGVACIHDVVFVYESFYGPSSLTL
jgi:hypothetical protein